MARTTLDIKCHVRECPKCGQETYTVDSRLHNSGATKRRRKCLNCDYTYNTYEIEESGFNSLVEAVALQKRVEVLERKLSRIKFILDGKR